MDVRNLGAAAIAAAVTMFTGCVAAPVEVEERHSSSVDFNSRYLLMDRSLTSLDAFRTSSVALHDRARAMNLSAVHATVTFRQPLPLDEAVSFIRGHNIDARLLYVHSTHGEELITSVVKMRTIHGTLRDVRAPLERAAQHQNAEIVGAVALVASIPSSEIEKIHADKAVFIVDLSADEHFSNNPGNADYAPSFAWDLHEQRN